MVDIKGLDKARVLKALYDNSHVQGVGGMKAAGEETVTVQDCAELLKRQTYFYYLFGRAMKVDLTGDEFDECLYDRDCGEGAAQRAVDSVRAEQENGGDANGSAGASEGKDTGSESGEKKEMSMDEKVKLTKDTIGKILDILGELPPDVAFAASVMLKATLPGMGPMAGVAGMLMMGGPFASPMGGLMWMKTSVHIADELDRAPFPFKGRFG